LAIDGGAPTVVPANGLGKTGEIAITQGGTLYIADPTNNRIVVEPAGGGTQTTLSISGVTPATLSGPMGVAVDGANNVYVSDTGNNRILEVNPLTGAATVLGNYVWIPGAICDSGQTASPCPSTGLSKETGSSVTATTAPPQYKFSKPQGIAVDTWNNVYVADTGNGKVVEIPSNPQLGGATPLLNYAGAPTFVEPEAIAIDSHNNIYVADPKVAGTQIIELPPGGGDLVNVPGSVFPNPGIGSGLRSPDGVAVDAAGDVYIADGVTNAVTEVPSATGPGSSPFALNFTTLNTATNTLNGLNGPTYLALDANGNLYVSDTGNSRVLFANRQNPMVNFGNVPQDQKTGVQPLCANTDVSDGFNDEPASGAGCVLTVSNIGNQPITLTSPITSIIGGSNSAYSVSNTCTSPLPSGLTCTISPTFIPSNDANQTETLGVNGTQQVALVANGAQPQASIVLTSSLGTSPAAGGTTTITATVTQPSLPGVTPTGSVTFTYVIDAINNNVNSCGAGGTQTVALTGSGGTATASFNLPTLAQGVEYTVTANYIGDGLNSATPANPLLITVPGIPVTATVTSTATQLTFIYGSTPPTVVGTVTPAPASGVTATFGSAATATTPIGTYPVVVSFSGSGSCAYGFPPSVFSTGGAAVVTENAAPLKYTIPNFTAQYGAANISYGASAVVTGAVNGDTFSATFTPSQSSILNVGTYSVVPTVTGSNVGDYTVTAPPSTLTIVKAPVSVSVAAAKTSVLATASAVAAATYGVSVSTAVTAGKGVPTGSITVSDTFTPITAAPPGEGATVPSCSILFTGATTSGSATISGLDSTFGLTAGESITGTGIPSGATISAVNVLSSTITISSS
jgi:sugar lactone lactonase YvrE